jgi:hypothetical protein
MLKKLEKQNKTWKAEKDHDKFFEFGFGIYSFLQIKYAIIKAFGVMSILAFAQIGFMSY